MRALFHSISPAVRGLGKAIDSVGVALSGHTAYVERLVPATTSIAVGGKKPSIALAHVATNATIIGAATFAERCVVWYNAVVAAEHGPVTVGAGSTIQDNAHVKATADHPVVMGTNVMVGAGAFIEGATLEDGAMVGCGARIGAGAVVARGSSVEAGSYLPPGTRTNAGEVWGGVPATCIGAVDVQHARLAEATAELNLAVAEEHAVQWKMTPEEVIEQYYEFEKQEMTTGAVYYEDTSQIVTERRGLLFDQTK